jgi:hypothetical protein
MHCYVIIANGLKKRLDQDGYSSVMADTQLFGSTARLGKASTIQLTPQQNKIYKRFRAQKAYFGAFYVREGTSFSGDTLNFHNFDTAKAAAKQRCELAANGKACTLYAVVYPQGVDPNAKSLKGFSQPAAKSFQTKYQRKQIVGKYGAFALNGAHGFGITYGWNSIDEAREAAIAFCDADSASAMAPLGIEGRKWVRARGLHKCRIVDTHTPE